MNEIVSILHFGFLLSHSSLFVICASSFACSSSQLALPFAQKRSITEKDLFSICLDGDPQVSAERARGVCARDVNEKKEGYNTSSGRSQSPAVRSRIN